MRLHYTKCLIPAALAVMLCGCNDTGQAPTQRRRPVTSERQEPLDPGFIGRVWVSAEKRGSIMVFLPDRTLLLASCSKPFRLVEWGVAGENRIRWREHAVPVEAEVVLPSKDVLQLKIVGLDREMEFVAAWAPYTCPTAQ